MNSVKISIVTGPFKGKVHHLSKNEIIIGRDDSCDVSLMNKNISRQHTKIIRKDNDFEIQDLNSRNGTFVNDKRISVSPLNNGDRIIIGGFMLGFYISDETAEEDTVISTRSGYGDIMIDTQGKGFFTDDLESKDITEIKKSKKDLATIYKISQKINSVLNIEKLYSLALDIIFEEIKTVEFCSILLLLHDDELSCEASRNRDPNKNKSFSRNFSKEILRNVLKEKKAILTHNVQEDERFDNSQSVCALDIRSTMCVPLQNRNAILGIIQANTSSIDHKFTKNDLEFLSAIGMIIGSAIQNAILYDQLSKEKQHLKQVNQKLKVAQDGLIQSEKLAAVGQLSVGIVHDIKNPITVIQGHVNLMQEVMKDATIQTKTKFDFNKSLNAIEEGAIHCTAVINQLLHFSKQKPLEKTDVIINELIQSALQFVSHEFVKNQIQVDTDFQCNAATIVVDINQIKQLLINIFLNAIQAMDKENATIKIHTSSGFNEDTEFLILTITDNGVGMSDKTKSKIFDPFFSTKELNEGYGGTGMGLAVSYGIIENHNGNIQVDSQEGIGTTFTISLPTKK